MEAASSLRLVIVPFIGTDKIDIPAASALGVLVANSPTPENFIAVAEATIRADPAAAESAIKHNEAKAAPRGVGAGSAATRGEFLFGQDGRPWSGLGRVGSHVARGDS